MYRQKEDIEEIGRLDEARLKLLVENRKLQKKLEKRNNQVKELEETVEELTRALAQATTQDSRHTTPPVEFKRLPHQVDRFREKFAEACPILQERIVNFLRQTQHYELNRLGNALFEGSKQQLEDALPVLQSLAPSMKLKNWCYLEHDHGDMTTCAGLRDSHQWSVEFTPNEIVFPEIYKNSSMHGWQIDMTPGSYSHPWGANFAI